MCSGIEAATVAWHGLGWTPVGFSEIEPFPSAVLAHHYPNVPNFGDMTQHEHWPLQPGSIDLLVGGTPCQSFSVAGLRAGLSDPRGGLMLTYLEIARRLRPRWVVWENVPGVLSSNGGRDFGSFLGAMGELRYGWAYRVIDAQYCRVDGRWPKAVPQRRRRVFVVGCDLERDPRGRERAAEVLALGTGLRWHLEESGKTRKTAPPDAEGCAGTVSSKWAKGTGGPAGDECYNLTTQPIGYRWQNNRDGLQQDDAVAAMRASTGSSGFHEMNHPVVVQPVPFTKSKRAQSVTDDKTWVDGQVNPTLSLFDQGDTRATTVAVAFSINTLTLGGRPDAVNDKRMTMGVGENGDPQFTLQAAHGHAVAHAFYSTGGTHGLNEQPEVSPAVKVGGGLGIPSPPAVAFSDTSATLKGGSGERGYPDLSDGNKHSMVGTAMTVRRLTAKECERLQAFPDDYTLIPWRKKQAEDCPDGPRYKALGNSMAVNCMAWIGERIAAVDAQMNERNET